MEAGLFAALDPSWSRPDPSPTWGDVTLAPIGTRRVLSLDVFAQKPRVYSASSPGLRWDCYAGSPDAAMLQAFVDAIRYGRPVPVSGVDGPRATEVALAA